jgi:hypothetical protein
MILAFRVSRKNRKRMWHFFFSGFLWWVACAILFALGGAALYEQSSGTVSDVTVVECQEVPRGDTGPMPQFGTETRCTGTWVVDGVRHSGSADWADEADIGSVVRVKVLGDTSFPDGYHLAVVFFVLGGLALGGGFVAARRLPGSHRSGPAQEVRAQS